MRLFMVIVATTSLCMSPTDATSSEAVMPPVPAGVEDGRGVLGFLNYWRSCLRESRELGAQSRAQEPEEIYLVITPSTHLLSNLAPQGSHKHPLYMNTVESKALKRDLVLDSLSTHRLSPQLLKPNSQQIIENLNKRRIVLKTDDQGVLTVNGVSVEGVDRLFNGISIVVLKDFLFDHRTRIQQIKATTHN
ncbi:uncharacterized protein LOC108668188 [Hyalella azteca]|uniref:Uncharacterized protein LOC108668188 n=1 Tax=Hyalella azteca TaxID=294128 RepID=A0A8B7NB87_HYAAZ|nr:uncharacterized protein LOC108668188 [Hyalella azteca]